MTNALSELLSGKRPPLEVVAAFLTQEGWPYEELGEQMILRSRFEGSSGEWICFAHYRVDGDQLLFYSVAPHLAPAAVRPALAEYLTRANWGLIIGNFELDYSDGEIRYRTSLQLNGTPLAAELLRPLIYGNVVAMNKYLPGIEAVIAQVQTADEAIAAVEGE
jgi:hypothetical protein